MADKCTNPNEGTVEVVRYDDSHVFTVNSTAKHVCKHGYDLDKGDLLRACLGANNWTGQPPVCSRIINFYVAIGIGLATIIIIAIFMIDFYYRVRKRRRRLDRKLSSRRHRRIGSFSVAFMSTLHSHLSKTNHVVQGNGGLENFGYHASDTAYPSSGDIVSAERDNNQNVEHWPKAKRKNRIHRKSHKCAPGNDVDEHTMQTFRSLPPIRAQIHQPHPVHIEITAAYQHALHEDVC